MGQNYLKKLLLTFAAATALSAPAYAAGSDFNSNRTDFRDESIYFMITTRFYDGDPHNNVLCWDNQSEQIKTNDPCWRGDFAGVIDKLDYIKALGFTAIWITPVVQNASGYDYHGYHAMDMSKVDLRYESHKGKGKDGGSTRDVDFQTLIDAAHAKGIKIILDIVLNHTGNFGENFFCKEFTRSQNILNQANINSCMIPNADVIGSDYASLKSDAQYQRRLAMLKNTDGKNHDSKNYYHHVANSWNWDEITRWWGQIAGDCVDLNTENPAVCQYLVDCYGKFIEMGVDGFRIDTTGHISRLSFNSYFIPKFIELGEKYKSKRLNQAPFYMYGECCARFGGVTYRDDSRLSSYYYTWKSDDSKVAAWKSVSADDWANVEVKEGADPLLNMLTCDEGKSQPTSDNTFMINGAYHEPDYSQSSGYNIIDFPLHYNFNNAASAYGLACDGDKYYNDATYNVVYVDSHDYSPQPNDGIRFSGGESQWAENLSLMFTFRGIPCLYYGSEIQFRAGSKIDNGPNGPLSDTGRAYFGGYITGNVNATDFGEYTADGNAAVTLSSNLSQHLIRLNKIRQAVPALRKGQWTSDGCTANGGIAFKRAYKDSYALVALNGGATFTGCPSGTYTDLVTGQTYSGSTITVSAPTNQGQLRVLVKDWTGGKIGEDGPFIYASSPSSKPAGSYDGQQEAGTTSYITEEDACGESGLSFSPNGGSFTTESLTVSVSLNEAAKGWYQINGGQKVEVVGATSFTIGAGDSEGTTYEVSWGATASDGTESTGTITYKKVGIYTPTVTESEKSVFLETDASSVQIWVWNTSTNYTGGDWGNKPSMEYMGITSAGRKVYKWTYSGSETADPTGVIFLPDGAQSGDITYVNHGYYVDNVYKYTVEPGAPSASYSVDKASQEFVGSISVTITPKNGTAVYTTDGSTPTASSNPITSAKTLTFTKSTTLKVGAVVDGAVKNIGTYTYQVATASYSVDKASQDFYGSLAVTITPKNGTVVYTTDGSTPTVSSNPITSAKTLTFSTTTTLTVGAVVDGAVSSVNKYTYTWHAEPVVTYTVDKASQTFSGSLAVTITPTGGTVVYTTDGSTPTASSTAITSAKTLTLSKTTTLMVGVLVNGIVSKVASYTYTKEQSGITIYVKADNAPYIHAWNNSGDFTTWPGIKLSDSQSIGGVTYYYTTFDTDNLNIVINNGSGSQTGNITGITESSYYIYDGGAGCSKVGDSTSPLPACAKLNTGKVSAYFTAPSNWGSTIYVHAWNGSGNITGEWPGVAITQVGTDNGLGVYEWISTAIETPTNIIFNNGNAQTADLVFYNNGCYTTSGYYGTPDASGVDNIQADEAEQSEFILYNLFGIPVAKVSSVAEARELLPNGIYIAKGQKILINK